VIAFLAICVIVATVLAMWAHVRHQAAADEAEADRDARAWAEFRRDDI